MKEGHHSRSGEKGCERVNSAFWITEENQLYNRMKGTYLKSMANTLLCSTTLGAVLVKWKQDENGHYYSPFTEEEREA